MNSEDIIKILNTRWGYGFLFLLLFIVVMFAVSSGMYCDLQIEKAVNYLRINECGFNPNFTEMENKEVIIYNYEGDLNIRR